MKPLIIYTTFLLIGMTAQAQKQSAFTGHYPDTKKTDQTDDYFGTKVSDPYRWLENDMSDETKSWVVDENKVTTSYLSQIPFREAIKKRLTELWN